MAAVELRVTPSWLDLLWILFLGVLASLPPSGEAHKLLILLSIGILQLVEKRFIQLAGLRGPIYAVLLKIALASLLLSHTQDTVPIQSSYWPIYFLPVMTAAVYFGPVGTLLSTVLSSAAYCAYLIPANEEFDIRPALPELALRIVFFFLVGMVVNRFVVDSRLQTRKYQAAAENLEQANLKLQKVQAEARRSERLAALGQLSAGLAHEIRNPLGVIKGSAEILQRKLGSGDGLAREMAGYIYTEVNRLSALVSRFLDFARPSRLQTRAAQVTDVLERALKAAEAQGALAHLNVHRDYAEGLPQLDLDEDLCEQVFINLIVNASQAMAGTDGELWVRTRPNTKTVVVEVADSGPGVPPEAREQIFNPFFTTKDNGVGLGLAIVSKIVDAHGGKISLVTADGPGACFQVTFPVPEERRTETHLS